MLQEYFRRHWFEIILVTVIMAVHVYAAASDAYNFPSSWFTRDDAYYYFKVAQNLTEGHGMTFDGVSPTNGYHPLWMLINIPIFALARFDLVLPLRILLLLQAGFSAGTAVLIYRVIRGCISHPLAVLGSTWWAFNLYIHIAMYEYGLETGLASFTVAVLVYRLYLFEQRWRESAPTTGQIAVLAVAALVALFSRLDLVFLAVLAGAWIILRETPLRVLLPLDMLLAAVSVFASFIWRLGIRDYYLYAGAALVMLAVSLGTKLVLYFLMGLYEPVVVRPFVYSLRQIAAAVTASSVLTGLVMSAASPLIGSFPRMALVYDWILNLVGMILLRALARVFSQGTNQEAIPPLTFLRAKWRGWLREATVFYGTLGIPLGLYMLLNKLLIGTAMPVSGQIKRWWGEASMRAYGGPARSTLAFWGVDFNPDFSAWNPVTGWLDALSRKIAAWWNLYRNDEAYTVLLIGLCIIWLALLLLNRRKAARVAMQASIPLLFAASLVQILSYNALGYSSLKEWYWITEPILLLISFSLALGILIGPLQQFRPAEAAVWLAVAAISLPLAWNFARVTIVRMPHGLYADRRPTLDIVEFLEVRTPPGSEIGMTGGGNVGYYIQDRTIVNLDGLINSPAYFEALRAGQANTYLRAIGLDFIFANPNILAGKPYRGQYATGAILGQFGGKALMEFVP